MDFEKLKSYSNEELREIRESVFKFIQYNNNICKTAHNVLSLLDIATLEIAGKFSMLKTKGISEGSIKAKTDLVTGDIKEYRKCALSCSSLHDLWQGVTRLLESTVNAWLALKTNSFLIHLLPPHSFP